MAYSETVEHGDFSGSGLIYSVCGGINTSHLLFYQRAGKGGCIPSSPEPVLSLSGHLLGSMPGRDMKGERDRIRKRDME